MTILGRLHGGLVFRRRVRVLGKVLADLLPENGRVLDVGCGRGEFLELAAGIPIKPEVQEYALEDANTALLELKGSRIKGAKVHNHRRGKSGEWLWL